MIKKLGFMILHQGVPYLRYAVQAILPQVDKLMIFYSAKPSQGYQTEMACPDTWEELMIEAYAGAWREPNNVDWIKGEWPHETAHVQAVNDFTEGYDWLFRIDADEIVPPGMVDEMIRQAETEEKRDAQEYRIPFCHFWRSFNRVCRDGSHPIRLTRLRGGSGIKVLDSDNQRWEVLHFGYCLPDRYIVYKEKISGHHSEWRPNWYEERWKVNAQRDLHPVCFPEHWHAEDYDKEKMPEIMRSHPYWNMEVIN